MDKFSYSLGIVLAQNLKSQSIDSFDPTSLVEGIEDIVKEKPLKISPEEAQQMIQNHLSEMAQSQHKGTIEAAEAFLTENRKKPEVTALPSGLQYEVLKTGGGGTPLATDEVTTHYHGMLMDGTVFDSSVQRGQPATFRVNQVIQGWVEALQLMTVGSKWRLFVPSDLAYGSQGAGDVIKPFDTLIFEVELLGIN